MSYPKTREIDEVSTTARPAFNTRHDPFCSHESCPNFEPCFSRAGSALCDHALLRQRNQAEQEAQRWRDKFDARVFGCRWDWDEEEEAFRTACGSYAGSQDMDYAECSEFFEFCPFCGGRLVNGAAEDEMGREP